MIELILAVVLATLVSASCSVAEAVLYSFPLSTVEKLKRDGRKSGKLLDRMRRDIEEPITAILTLNTIAHTAGAAIAGAAWAKMYGDKTLGLFALVFTVIILIFSEILPKTVGVVYSRPLAPILAKPLFWLVLAFGPLIKICGYLGRMVRSGKDGPEHNEDDIRAIVSLTRRNGVLKPYEAESIRNILSLDTKVTEQIMTPRTVVFSLSADMTVAQARETHVTWPHSRIPVYGDDSEDVVGVVYRRSVFEALADGDDDKKLGDLMKPVRFIPENLTLDRLLVKFLGSRMHLLVVLDEYGGVAGVVTLEDVLEEILGSEIVDETDQVVDMRELARRQRSELMEERAKESGKARAQSQD